jgi:hypothetical protein
VSLPEALEAAASALRADAEAIRPANGDPVQLLSFLEPDAAARVLGWVLAHRPDQGAELADAWAAEPAGKEILLALDDGSLPKAGRKALRRVRHRLRSRGVEVPEKAPEPMVSSLPPIEDELSGGYVSPIDPGGTRIVYLLEANPSGGARLFEVVIDDGLGVVDCQVYSSGRSKVRQFLREVTGRAHFAAAEAPPDSVRALIARAVAVQAADRSLPQTFSEWRGRLTDVRDDAPTPGELVRRALGDDPGASDPQSAVELVKQGRVGPWPPSQDALKGLAERLEDTVSSPLIVSGATRREQIEAVIGEFLGETYTDGGVAREAHRFREAAYVFWKRGDEEAARTCLAAALAFESSPIGENPVARAMLEVPLAPVLEKIESDGEEPQESSLLVRP